MSLKDLMETQLPLNRKERYFTGTVFPMIVCRDGFRYFSRFTALIPNYIEQPIDASAHSANIQFFTEYSLVESVRGTSKAFYSELPETKDTPDIIILIAGNPKVLIALEAKLYLAANQGSLIQQMNAQRVHLDYVQSKLNIQHIYHCALLPAQWVTKLNKFPYPVLTWQDLYKQFAPLSPNDYFLEVLRIALETYDMLVSKTATSGRNNERKMQGLEIYDAYQSGFIPPHTMGCQGGLSSPKLLEEIRSGQWRNRMYETSSSETLATRNWFLVVDFVSLVDKHRS
jgi:hypothetical protein